MNPRNLAALSAALCAVLGAHLGPLLLAVATVAIVGAVLILTVQVASVVLVTGWGCVPARKARA